MAYVRLLCYLRWIKGRHSVICESEEETRDAPAARRASKEKSRLTYALPDSEEYQGGSGPLIVGDSSFIIEALLNDRTLFEQQDHIVSPEFALYEIANTIWKHEFLLKDLPDGMRYISLLLDLVDSGVLVLVRPDLQLVKRTYEISGRKTISIYDAFFVTFALETGLELKSLDRTMIKIFDEYRRKTR